MPLHLDLGQTSEPQGWHRCRQRVDDSRRGHPSGKPGSFWPVAEKANFGRARQRLGLAQAGVGLRHELGEGLVPGIGLGQGKDQSLGLLPATLFALLPDDKAGYLLAMMP